MLFLGVFFSQCNNKLFEKAKIALNNCKIWDLLLLNKRKSKRKKKRENHNQINTKIVTELRQLHSTKYYTHATICTLNFLTFCKEEHRKLLSKKNGINHPE